MECKGQEELCGESGGLNFKREEGPPPVGDVQGQRGERGGGGGETPDQRDHVRAVLL